MENSTVKLILNMVTYTAITDEEFVTSLSLTKNAEIMHSIRSDSKYCLSHLGSKFYFLVIALK